MKLAQRAAGERNQGDSIRQRKDGGVPCLVVYEARREAWARDPDGHGRRRRSRRADATQDRRRTAGIFVRVVRGVAGVGSVQTDSDGAN